MPIYEFECAACGNVFDRLQKLSDPDPTACPECSQPNVKRRLSAPAFRLAGSGWYETDFKKEGDTKRNLVGKDEAPKSETKVEAKTDAKPDTKPGAKPEAKPDAKPAPASKPDAGGAGA